MLPLERNVFKLLVNAEGFFLPISQLLDTVFRKTRELTTLEWQLVVIRTAARIEAHYVFEIDTAMVLINGMPNAKRLLNTFGEVDNTEFSPRGTAFGSALSRSSSTTTLPPTSF